MLPKYNYRLLNFLSLLSGLVSADGKTVNDGEFTAVIFSAPNFLANRKKTTTSTSEDLHELKRNSSRLVQTAFASEFVGSVLRPAGAITSYRIVRLPSRSRCPIRARACLATASPFAVVRDSRVPLRDRLCVPVSIRGHMCL